MAGFVTAFRLGALELDPRNADALETFSDKVGCRPSQPRPKRSTNGNAFEYGPPCGVRVVSEFAMFSVSASTRIRCAVNPEAPMPNAS
jgi:hypothetical protein